MEIVRLINDTWQLIDSATESVVMQGTWDECFDKLAELDCENERGLGFGMQGRARGGGCEQGETSSQNPKYLGRRRLQNAA